MTLAGSSGSTTADAELVADSLGGSREAFGQLVARYQALVCAVAYSGTGRLDQSEDLAQETFLAAWRQLRELREPARVRAWLCGIARNLVQNTLRREGREPARAADPLEAAAETPSALPQPAEQAISREEEAILWRSLERIPETYREPLVLFYREHQSIEQVALALDLSEELVRQRLSRGRKLLHQQVAAFVEGALERSRPGSAFTLSVIAALPQAVGTGSALAAGAGALKGGALKGGALASSAGLLALFNLLFGPGLGFVSSWLSVRSALDVARTGRERDEVLRQLRAIVPGVLIFVAGLIGTAVLAARWDADPRRFAAPAAALALVYAAWIARFTWRSVASARRLRAEERSRRPEAFAADGARDPHELKSRATLLGLPLYHLRFGPPAPGAGPALGWIAVGDRAVGVLFAFGSFAVGAVSVGTVSAGLVTVGGVSAGVIAIGSVTAGLLVMGGACFGLYACGGLAFGWRGALGGVALARDWALGGVARAAHAGDAAARALYAASHGYEALLLLLGLTVVLSILPPAWLAWRTRRLRSRNLP